MIVVGKLNETFLQVSCERHIAYEINEYFSFKVPNAQFHPKFKAKIWDGKIRLFNINTGKMYLGLYPYLKEWADKHTYALKTDIVQVTSKSINYEECDAFMNSISPFVNGKQITPRDYQVESFVECVKRERALLLSPTSSGKSLVIYSLIRWHQQFLDNDKILILVPTTNLVTQMYNDFKDYSSNTSDWNVENQCHMIYSGREKESEKQIYISTWQSLFRLGAPYFKKFGMVVGDEAHLCNAQSLKGILEKMTTCRYRFGTTGTITDSKTNKLVLEGLFGKTYTAVTSKQLMDDKHISDLRIDCLVLKYSDVERQSLTKSTYKEEIDFIVQHKKRNEFIRDLALLRKGNVLILFNYVEKHGKVLYKMLQEKNNKDRNIFFIAGETSVEDREKIRQVTEVENSIIVASSGVLSTGVNIKNLQTLIFAHPYKAKIRNLQSIGRVLRLDDKDNKAILFDIVDDLTWKKHHNYGIKHWKERVNTYLAEQFDYVCKEITL
jgi:superfamily II DNA or RNA helicase